MPSPVASSTSAELAARIRSSACSSPWAADSRAVFLTRVDARAMDLAASRARSPSCWIIGGSVRATRDRKKRRISPKDDEVVAVDRLRLVASTLGGGKRGCVHLHDSLCHQTTVSIDDLHPRPHREGADHIDHAYRQ